MCVYSMVMDQYRDRFYPYIHPATYPQPIVYPTPRSDDYREIADLIREFKEAVREARAEDIAAGTPDCEDPVKAELEERVKKLEEAMGLTVDP